MNFARPQVSTLDETNAEVSLRDVIAILFRRLKGMTAIFILAMLIALVWIFVIRTDVYEVNAKILVRIGYEQAPSVTMMDRQIPIVGYRNQDVATEVHILSSTDVLGRVVDKLNLGKIEERPRPTGFFSGIVFDIRKYWTALNSWLNEQLIRAGLRERMSPRESVIDALSKGLRVGSSQESNVMVASLRLPSRKGTAAVLDAILSEYLNIRMGFFREDGAMAVFRDKMAQSLNDLRVVEKQIRARETRDNIVNYSVQEKLLLEREKQLESQVESDRQELNDLTVKLSTLKEVHGTGNIDFSRLGAFPQRTFPAELMSELARIENERIQLEMSAGGRDQRSVKENDERFKKVMAMLKNNITSTWVEKQSLLASHLDALKDTRTELDGLHHSKTAWQDLKRRSELLDANYKLYRQKYEEAYANSALGNARVSNVKIIQHPVDPVRPAGIRKLYLIYIAALLSTFITIIWASLIEFFDHHVYSSAQAAKYLGVPVVGVVSRLRTRDLRQSVGYDTAHT